MITVARRYKFEAQHHLPAVGPPWNEPHRHHYTVEVQASVEQHELVNGLVVDTDALDKTWGTIALVDGNDLNATHDDTSVEGLAAEWLAAFRAEHREVVAVTVWEDDDRWGAASI